MAARGELRRHDGERMGSVKMRKCVGWISEAHPPDIPSPATPPEEGNFGRSARRAGWSLGGV